MSPITLAKKTGKKPSLKPVEKKKPLPPPEPTGNSSSDDEEGWTDEDSEDDGGSGEEDDGVDEVGFEKLIKALGDDGLDDYDQANLAALAREEEDEESGEGEDAEGSAKGLKEVSGHEEGEEVPEVCDEAEEGRSGSVAGTEEGESSGDESVLALDELEDVELHPDAVPRRGVKVIDQKACAARVTYTYIPSNRSLRMRSRGLGKPSDSTPNFLGRKPSSYHTQRLTRLTTRMT
jgi:rRNA-processing protein EBP2